VTLDVVRYLERIGYTGPTTPTPETLVALQRAHLLAVPFEALDCFLEIPIRLEPGALFDKVIIRRRGGFCYELNGLFGELLSALGFRVRRLAARPFTAGAPGGLAPPFAHMALLVELDRRWLTDVGFGFFTREPLDVDRREIQIAGGRQYRVSEEEGGLVVEDLGMARRWGYAFTLTPHALGDYAEQCRIYSTDPESGFVKRAVVSRAFEDGWITVTREEVIGGRGGTRLDRAIAGDADWRATLRSLLGVEVPPRVAGVG
jgi:N-hydroxyarylamine O-acetyltransferase